MTSKALLLPLALALLTLCVLLPEQAAAQSVGVSPGSVELTDALRGATYHEQIRLINQRDDEQTYELTVEGEAADWITLYDAEDRRTPTSRVTSKPEVGARVIAEVAIPDDASNRLYTAEITMQQVVESDNGEGPSEVVVGAGLRLDVNVDVTGTQRLAGAISGLEVRDTEVGLPLRVTLDFQNTGNVSSEPLLRLWILDDAGELLQVVEEQDIVVPIDQAERLRAEWPTDTRSTGHYLLGIEVQLGEEVMYEERTDFDIYPEGYFTRQGEFDALEIAIQPNVGGVAKLNAIFHNTGEVDTQAQFVGEIYFNDQLIDTAESQDLVVLPAQRGALEVFVRADERGRYRVEGLVNFEGKETATLALEYKVPPDLGGGGCLGFACWQVIGGGVVVVVIAAAAAVEVRRRLEAARSSPESA